MAHEAVPPGFVSDFKTSSSTFFTASSSEPSQDWLTAEGDLRRDKLGKFPVAPFENGAMKLAFAQGSTVFQTGLMLYFAGAQLSVYSIIIVSQVLSNSFALARMEKSE